MRKSKLILFAAATVLTAVFAGCDGKGEDNPSPAQTFTVTFVSNGGSAVESQTVANGDKATEPAPPAREGYYFDGWYTDNDTFADKWNFAARTVSAVTTLYANWLDVTVWYAIRTAADFDAVRSNLSGNYVLMNDISLTNYDAGAGWTPLGAGSAPFTGKFKGNNHKITGLVVNSRGYAGLFGCISGASVNDLGVEIVADVMPQNIYAGGITGVADNSTITNCHSAGNISATDCAGGIAGYVINGSTITNCCSVGNISAHSNSGGIAGMISNGIITNCYSTGKIVAYYNSGGIAGIINNGTITNCYSTGNISSYYPYSGTYYFYYSGGIAGWADESDITNCYSTGNIYSASYGFAGGIAGNIFDGTITNCAAINSTIKADYAGRIVGDYGDEDTVSNNFALNTMTIIFTGMWQSDASDPMFYGVSKTAAQLQTQSTYSAPVNGDGLGGLGWKFGNDDNNPWKMPAGGGFPILYWQ